MTKTGRNGKADGSDKTLSVTDLELQFAQNPESNVYIQLTEAYLTAGRYMEAMVVCKKAVKAHADAIEPRLLLARVYAEQKKYKRALQELDELIEAKPNAGAAFLARGKLRIESGEADAGVADLRKAIDLDATLVDASAALKERGIIYPEPKAPPPAPPPITNDLESEDIVGQGSSGPGLRPPPMRGPASGVRVTGVPVSAQSLPPLSGGMPPMQAGPRSGSFPPMPGMPTSNPSGFPISSTGWPVMRQRLEGEEELEELASKVATEKPKNAKPITTLFMLIGMGVLALGVGGYLILHKRKVEGIDRLSAEGEPAFNKDTYGSYKRAADSFAEILKDYDGNHPLTLGRLAHTYAILWGEHGEASLKPKLDEVLARAKAKAPKVSHTIAAEGLVALYSNKDRRAAAEAAEKIVQPMVDRTREGGAAPTHADLVLGLSEIELGEYEAAVRRLGAVKEGLPQSVRAKIWHARAAYKANRFGTARAAYESAIRAEPNHPGARAGLSLVRLEVGDLMGAAAELEAFDRLAKEMPKEISPKDSALAEFARSEILRSAGQTAKATGAYENAIRLDPDNADIPFGLGRSLLKGSKPKEALEPLKKAVEMEPSRTAFQVELAEAEMASEDNAAAEQRLKAVIAKTPDYVPAQVEMAKLYRRGNKPDAETFIGDLLKKFPSAAVELNLELARVHKNKGKVDEATTLYLKIIDEMTAAPPSVQGDVLLSYGRLVEEKGDRPIALESYKQAAERGAIEANYKIAMLLGKSTAKPERDEAKKACGRYLGGGAGLRYYDQMLPLCQSIAP